MISFPNGTLCMQYERYYISAANLRGRKREREGGLITNRKWRKKSWKRDLAYYYYYCTRVLPTYLAAMRTFSEKRFMIIITPA